MLVSMIVLGEQPEEEDDEPMLTVPEDLLRIVGWEPDEDGHWRPRRGEGPTPPDG